MGQRILLAFALAGLFSPSVTAEMLDYDDASRAAYSDGWRVGDDGSASTGYLGAWVMGADSVAPRADIQSAAGLGTGKSDIDSNGKAFKLHDPGGGYVDVFRFFDPLGLEPGETFSIDLAVNFRGGFKGLDVRDDREAVIFNVNIGDDDYTVSKSVTGNGSIGPYHAHTVLHISVTQTSLDTGKWAVTRKGGIPGVLTGTYEGQARSIKLYSGNQDAGPENALFFNNLEITAE